jgi:hypothetical protein
MRKMLCNMLFLGLTALVVIVTSGASSQARPRGPVLGAAPPDLYCLQGRILELCAVCSDRLGHGCLLWA